ncbi:MAG: helix-turn-helix transcriptional regulator [Patescibacteria group bacterium]
MDNLQLSQAKIGSLKSALKEISDYFEEPQHQETLIQNIRVLMGLRNIGVEDLSKAAGKNRSYVGRLLRNDFPKFNPSVETIRGLAMALKVKPSVLVMMSLSTEFQNVLKNIERRVGV